MNSRELGLVSSAYNSLLGTMGSQTAQQVDSTKSFTSVLDNKLQSANKSSYAKSNSFNTTQVNREELSAKDSEYEKDRDAFVKSGMQQPKKEIVRAEKETSNTVSDQKHINGKRDEKKVDDVEAIESVDSDTVEEVEVKDDNQVIESIMALLSNDQLVTDEKIAEITALLNNLSSEDLENLKGLTGDLKKILMSLDGSLKNFEDVLAKLPSLEGEFSNLLSEMQSLDSTAEGTREALEDPELTLQKLSAAKENGEVISVDGQTETAEIESIDKVLETATQDKTVVDSAKDAGKETKTEMLKENSDATDKTTVVAEMSNPSASNNQSSQQQSNAEGNQSFTEALKFHSANVKTVAMKGSMASNPFEEKIMQQIIKGASVSLNVGKDVSEMMIKLNPKELGNVSLKISLENEQLVAKFNVENQTVKEVLESRLEDLRTALSDKGFTIEGLDVSVSQDAEEQFKSYEEFIKQQKGKKKFNEEDMEGVEGIAAVENTSSAWQSLETTSSEINVLA